MSTLTVVSAGAGTGKTYDICEAISDAIIGGLDPARLLATTYTRKAAAELKGRLQERILRDERIVNPKERQFKAECVELAAVGTVHSVGHQLLTRYAIQLGLSPHLKVLEEEGSRRCLHDLLSGMDLSRWEALAKLARKLSIEDPQSLVLKLLDAKRSNLIEREEFSLQLRQSLDRYFAIMAPAGPLAQGTSFDQLYALAKLAIDEIKAKNDNTAVTAKAVSVLVGISNSKEPKWQDFLSARKIEAGKKSGADQCLSALRAASVFVRQEPDLHLDIKTFVEYLINEMNGLESQYAQYKIERGLLDFIDLEVLFLKLLNQANLSDSLSTDFDLIVVDEFQDTNPIQLAIFQRLKSLARESRWVGDPKQSIFGFRGTDPDFIKAAWDAVAGENRRNLVDNYRSRRGIVQIVGELFGIILGDGAIQSAKRDGSSEGIERWLFETKNQEQDFQALAVGIAQLNGEGIALRDIAILVRSNSSLAKVGSALTTNAIPALLELPGLFSTREGTLVICGLRLVADRRDSLAAATILHLYEDHASETPEWLKARLQELQSDQAEKEQAELDVSGLGRIKMPWDGHPLFRKLEQIDARTFSPSVIVQLVMDALDVGTSLREWGDPARRASHIDAIKHLAKQYEEQAEAMGSAVTLSGLNSYLGGLAADDKDIRLAPHGLDAVTVLTYHKSKGLEWPVVVLTDLGGAQRDPDMWSPLVSGGDPTSEQPLNGRAVRFWPWPFGRNPMIPSKILDGSNLSEDALQSDEGKEATEKDRQEAIRLLYVGFTRARDKLVLAHRQGDCSWLQQLPEIDRLLSPTLDSGEHPLSGIDTTYRVRKLNHGMTESIHQNVESSQPWLNKLSSVFSDSPRYPARYWSPSESVPAAASSVTITALPGNSIFPANLTEEKEAALGNACHAYFASLRSMESLDRSGKANVALRLLKGFSVEAQLTVDQLVSAGERFDHWINSVYPGATWVTEVPVSAPRKSGGQWVGAIDLLLIRPDNMAVIIDHKSGPIRREHCATKALSYTGQLQAYREIVEAQRLKIEAIWVHFLLSGIMANVSESTT